MIGGHPSRECLAQILVATLSDGRTCASEVKTFEVMIASWRRRVIDVEKQEGDEGDAHDEED